MRTLLIWLALAASAFGQIRAVTVYPKQQICPNGQCPIVAQPQPQIVTTMQPAPAANASMPTFKVSLPNLQAAGSATCVYRDANHAVFLTAKHVPRDSRGQVMTHPCTLTNGAITCSGRIAYQSHNADLAAILVMRPPLLPVMKVAASEPPDGARLRVLGYPYGRSLRDTTAILVSKNRMRDGKYGTPLYFMRHGPIEGESGGSISYNGRLVAVISAGNQVENISPGLPMIHEFVRKSYPYCLPTVTQPTQLMPQIVPIAQQQPAVPAVPNPISTTPNGQGTTINIDAGLSPEERAQMEESIKLAIQAWLLENAESFRGPAGPPGPAGGVTININGGAIQ